jgi:hypothetical protein
VNMLSNVLLFIIFASFFGVKTLSVRFLGLIRRGQDRQPTQPVVLNP